MADVTEIRISVDTRIIGDTSQGGESPEVAQPANQDDRQKQVNKGAARTVALAVAADLGKKAIQWGISNYGELTGDYTTQQALQTGIELAGSVAIIAASGWIGAAAVAANYTTKFANNLIAMRKSQTSAAMLQARTQTLVSKGGR